MLSLAQIYLDMNEGQQAIATLEDPKFGPLTLVQAKSPLASKPGFAIETYKVAVRAYVALQQAVKAKAVIDALDKAVAQSADPASKENLNAIYVTIGRELQQQLERLRKDGSKKEIDAASDAFEAILSRIASHSAGNTFASLSWVADTFYSLAAAADDPSLPATDRVKNYYQHAADAYQEILAQAAKDPKFVPGPDDLIRIQLRTAVSLRRTGDFDKAIKLVVEVLKQRPTMLTAQIVGAETYAAQGERERDGYMRSIMGGSPDKQGHNLIWGWSQLATVTQGKPKYEETFYQARLKIAEGRLLYGMTVVDQPQREKIFEAAKNDLWVTYRIYHDLGGPESAAKYDMLLKRIQQQLHQPLEGLREFKEREAAGNKEQDEKAKSA
jgi:tetratricopeptide (TPR) repeat protein